MDHATAKTVVRAQTTTLATCDVTQWAEIAAGAHDLSPMASERSSNPRFTWTRLDDDISTWSESSRPGKSVPRKMPATTVGAWSA